jgi:hypothetical protein
MNLLAKFAQRNPFRLDDLERRVDALERAMSNLATKEQVSAVASDVTELKSMISILLSERTGK